MHIGQIPFHKLQKGLQKGFETVCFRPMVVIVQYSRPGLKLSLVVVIPGQLEWTENIQNL